TVKAPTRAPPQEFPPDDPRAMSPRRTNEETDKMLVKAGPPQEFPPDDARAVSPRRTNEETDKMLVNA
ncbi:MAG: hypothetical protein Q9192_007790, partial [Flavoplaca navasiana]